MTFSNDFIKPPINYLLNRQKKKAETFWTLLEHTVCNTETKTLDYELRTFFSFLDYTALWHLLTWKNYESCWNLDLIYFLSPYICHQNWYHSGKKCRFFSRLSNSHACQNKNCETYFHRKKIHVFLNNDLILQDR